MSKKVASVQIMEFADKTTGKMTTMYRIYVFLDDGSIASIYTKIPFEVGEEIEFKLTATKDGKLAVKVAD